MLRLSAWVVVIALIFAAVDELVLALTGSWTPAEAATGIGYLAILAACVLVFARGLAAALLAPAAGLFVTARFYTQNPDYSGFHRTFAMDGYPQPAFVWVMLALSLAAGAATYRWRLPGAIASLVVLAVLLLTVVLFGAGY